MKTIKLSYTCSKDDMDFIKNEIRKSSNMIRFAYNRFGDGESEKDIRLYSHSLNNIPADSWFIQCAIKKAGYLHKTNNEKVIFGGKFNFFQRLKNKIAKDKYKEKRLLAVYSQGEVQYKGNRKFDLDIGNNQIVFKFSKSKHIILKFPKLHKNYLNELTQLESLANQKKCNYSIELKSDTIYITFDDTLIYKSDYKGLKNIIAGIDMNPNYIGFNISKFKGDEQIVLYKEQIDLSYFTQNLHKSSDDRISKKQNNKQLFEITQVSKHIINLCKKYGVSQLGIEDLRFKTNSKIKSFNRLTKNKWKKEYLTSSIKKQCILINIRLSEVNPCYSSFIGNTIWNAPDPIAASLEIARRAYFKYIKGKFFSSLIKNEDLPNQWKKEVNQIYSGWKELFDIIKTSGVKYRRSLDLFEFKVFRLMSSKSNVIFYKIYNSLE